MNSDNQFERILSILEQIYDYDLGWMANLNNLALRLSSLVNRKSPWGAKYLNNLIKGYSGFSISEDLNRALEIQEKILDGQSEIMARAQKVNVFIINGVEPGSVILGDTVWCAYCQVKFVPRSVNGKYCCAEHKRLFYNEKRRMKNA